MKNKKITFLIFLFLALSLILGSAKTAFGYDATLCGITLNCSPPCADCSWCPQEDITGKVYNPTLPGRLSATPGMIFLQKLLQTGILLALIIGSLIFFFMLLTGGVKWISAGSDKGGLEGAQKQITHALIGLAILLSTFAIIGLMGYLFGIDLLKITLPTL